jgi:hypothetical protein
MNAHATTARPEDEPAAKAAPKGSTKRTAKASAKSAAAASAKSAPAPKPTGIIVNPVTGLGTDYLNHFNEAIMVLEMLPQMPECIAELTAWRPLTYAEHFSLSHFHDRKVAIAAYKAADPTARIRLEELAETMNEILIATREALRATPDGPVAAAIAGYAAAQLKPLVARAGAVINGTDAGHASGIGCGPGEVQATIDALLARNDVLLG